MAEPSHEELELEAEALSPVADEERDYGRYQLQYEIASGGMASVYLARSVGAAGFERPIAIKRIHPHLAKKQIFVDMFLDEARLNARIAHPNVCNVLDFGEAEGSYFMAMEYLVGQPLSRVLSAVATRPELAASKRWHALAARILADACQGLHAAHELVDELGEPMNVVHRDFTPHNIFVTYDGAVKVFDFGVARAEGRLHHTETGILKGKLAYMSPEQLSRATIDRRLDVWAAGVCLWELLAVRRLFGKRSELEIVQAIGAETIVAPSQVRAGVPPELDVITLRALERDPDRRTNSARLLARELNQFISATGVMTSIEDVAELMAELFPEERARKLDVVANLLRSEDGANSEPPESSSVHQRARSSTGSLPAPRLTTRGRAAARTPTSMRAPAPPSASSGASLPPPLPSQTLKTAPPPEALVMPASPASPQPPVEEEATVQSSVELAHVIEELHTSSAAAHGVAAISEADAEGLLVVPRGSAPATPTPDAQAEGGRAGVWAIAALGTLVVLGVSVFLVVVSGVVEREAPFELVPAEGSPPAGVAAPSHAAPSHATEPTAGVPSATPAIATPTTTAASPPTVPAAQAGTVAPSVQASAPPEADAQGSAGEEAAGGEARRGSVNVAARGGWADLFVDGRLVGRTPRSLPMSPGRHVIELRPPTGPVVRRVVNVLPGRTQRLVVDL